VLKAVLVTPEERTGTAARAIKNGTKAQFDDQT
jgi:hypothetical protein